MKKSFIITFFAAIICVLSFTACGSGYAKIVGVKANVAVAGGYDIYNNGLHGGETLENNDFVLKVDTKYDLLVGYTFTGGSRIPVVKAENFKLIYDTEILEISLTSETEGEFVRYSLVCKRAVKYTALVAEVDGIYSDTIIISAN